MEKSDYSEEMFEKLISEHSTATPLIMQLVFSFTSKLNLLLLNYKIPMKITLESLTYDNTDILLKNEES